MTSHELDQITDMQEWLGMIERLGRAPDWPEGDRPIETIQTHISIILLGKRYALKLKKPVNFGFLDYTTLEKRRLACEAEIVLNRRLCPEAYLGVQAVREREGRLYFAGAGKIVEYGVL